MPGAIPPHSPESLEQMILLRDLVENCIHHSIDENMTKQETMDSIFTILGIPPLLTQLVWEILEEQNPEYFQAYYARLALMRQHQNGITNINGQNSIGSHHSTQHIPAHTQNGGEYMTPNGAQNGVGNQQPRVNNGSSIWENGVDHQRVNGQILANGAQNGMRHHNGVGNQQPRVNNGSSIWENSVDHQRVNGQILANGAQNGMRHHNGVGNQQPRVNNGSSIRENGVDHQRVNGQILGNGGSSSHPN